MKSLQHLLAVIAVGCVGSVATAQPSGAAPKAAPAVPATQVFDGPLVVFFADGASGSTDVSQRLRNIVDLRQIPMEVRPIAWCRDLDTVRNFTDQDAQLAAAACVVDAVKRLRQHCPNARVALVGYSAGSRVVLAAAEMLPVASIDRIVLLGSSVSSCYDLRPALKATYGGIDSFFSREDRILLAAERYLGTSDGQNAPTAGRVGFHYPGDPKQCAAYGRLRQYEWTEEMNGQGGHAFWANSIFLRFTLTPMLLSPPEIVLTPARGAGK
jgi:pimeloyl-ACP methyl ester carboxylesterase